MVHLSRLFHQLVRFETELWNAVDRRLQRDPGLPLSWFEPLQQIGRYGGSRVQDIAGELGISVGGTSKLVDRIERAGYCRRRPHPSDRRSSLVELTAEGDRLLVAARPVFEAEVRRRTAEVLPADSLQRFADTLSRLRAAGRALDAEAEEDPLHA